MGIMTGDRSRSFSQSKRDVRPAAGLPQQPLFQDDQQLFDVMSKTNETWTKAHDLALIYLALAYGTDAELSDSELDSIIRSLKGWRREFEMEQVHEVVMEAMAVYLEGDAEAEISRSLQALGLSLSQEERHRALEEVMRIAEADGVVLSTERSLIQVIAHTWEIKAAGDRLLKGSDVSVEKRPSWTLMHDLALIYIVVAHSTDNDLSEAEIGAVVGRLNEWQPELGADEVRGVVHEALTFYSDGPDGEALQASVRAIKDVLPPIQRLAVLDDLVYIAEVDGSFKPEEKAMIGALSQAWDISVRLNGQAVR